MSSNAKALMEDMYADPDDDDQEVGDLSKRFDWKHFGKKPDPIDPEIIPTEQEVEDAETIELDPNDDRSGVIPVDKLLNSREATHDDLLDYYSKIKAIKNPAKRARALKHFEYLKHQFESKLRKQLIARLLA